MSSSEFLWSKRGAFEVLTSASLSAQGIEHGFIGKSADFSPRAVENYLPSFKLEFDVSRLVLLDQVHGNKIVSFGDSDLCADGIFVPRSSLPTGERTAFGIRVADCLALFYVTSQGVCLVHAGWKGLAQGIHLAGLKRAFDHAQGCEVQVALWPCASLARYEVGAEVIDSFTSRPTMLPGKNGKFYLGLRETAQSSLLANSSIKYPTYISQECTIDNSAFHSYRRESSASGRNLAFMIL